MFYDGLGIEIEKKTNMEKVYTVVVEEGKPGKDGNPSVGPVYRNALAKDGFPPLEPDMTTSWDCFRYCLCACQCTYGIIYYGFYHFFLLDCLIF